LENNQLYFMVTFAYEDNFAVVNIPTEECGRFITFSMEEEQYKITFLDDLLKVNIPQLFPEKEIDGIFEIKLSRDAELYIDDEIDGLLAEKIYDSL
ncbi:polyphosphate kinase 1, partial [Tamlana crocina]|nr:polyphosphate kinase 1 [Tamlana crocina]